MSAATTTTTTFDKAENEKLPLSTSDVRQAVKIRMGESGVAALPPKTVMQCWDEIVQRLGDEPALFQKRPNPETGVVESTTEWTSWTWKEYRAQVDAFGKSLLSIGFDRHESVNILGFNSPEWFFSYFGAIAAGGIAVGIYTTNNVEACQYVSEHSNAKVVVVEGMQQLEKYIDISKDLKQKTGLKALVVYGLGKIDEDVKKKCAVNVYTFDEFLKLGTDSLVEDKVLQERSSSWKPNDIATLIYTSGTTGPPKGVMITNDNITWTTRATLLTTRRGFMDETDVMVSYLPLSHIAAQLIDVYTPLLTGCKIYFAQADALKGSLGATLKDVRPTCFFGVPRVWEKIYEKLQEVGKATTGIKKTLSTWAKGCAADYWDAMQYENLQSSFIFARDFPAQYYVAQFLLSKAHVALGFDRCYAFYVSAAPMELKVFKYFASLDIPIMEVFGMSECTGPHINSQYNAFVFGSVGRPMPGAETKCDEKNQGELCLLGRNVFAGYKDMPEQTKATIDEEGWLHSGDIASIDENHTDTSPKPSGFVRITGRIKELIVTAGGENVPPVLIEDQMKVAMPALGNIMVIGDKRKFLSAIFCLRVVVDAETAIPTNQLAGVALDVSKEIGSSATTADEARECAKWKEYFEAGLKKANAKATSNAQKVQKYHLLSTDFSEKGGELTPTLKLKRSAAATIHKDVIEAMYA